MSNGKKRFDVSSTDELESASVKFVPKNTTVAINWAFRIFVEWVRHSGEIEGCSYKSEDLWLLRDPEFYAKMMSLFCLEVKQQNCSSYTLKSLLQILINLQKYARSQDPDKACEKPDIRSKTLSNDNENMDTADQVSGILKRFNFEKMDGVFC